MLDHAKQSTTYALKTVSKTAVQKSAKVNDDFIGNKTPEKITKGSKNFITK